VIISQRQRRLVNPWGFFFLEFAELALNEYENHWISTPSSICNDGQKA